MAQIPQMCLCGRRATHEMEDGRRFCCACFDVAVEHCANLRASGVMFSPARRRRDKKRG